MMLEVYSQALAVTTGTAITFATTAVQTNQAARLNDAGNAVLLQAPGRYLVDFHAYGSSTATGTIGAQLTANGTAVPQAASVATTAAGEPQAIGFSSIVTVAPTVTGNTATIAVNYIGAAGTLTVADLIVHRLA